MSPDFSCVRGQSLRSIEKKDFTWFFTFSEQAQLLTEGDWRLVADDHIVVTSEDHSQKFGLSAPVDAADLVLGALRTLSISDTRLDNATGDLFLTFAEGTFLQFLQMSAGYESWRFLLKGVEYICLGGGTSGVNKIVSWTIPTVKSV